MTLIEAISSIKAAIDASASNQTDHHWKSAVSAAGLISQGDVGNTGIDESYQAAFGQYELKVRHTWKDTSRTFQIGPDRTRVELSLVYSGKVVDSYTNGYQE